MKFEIYNQESGDIFLLSPPSYLNLNPFCFYHSQVKSWLESDWFQYYLEQNTQFFPNLIDGHPTFDAILQDYLALFVYRNNRQIAKNTLTNQDLIELIKIGDRLLELSELPAVKEDKTGFNPNFMTTGDDYSDLVGDLLHRFGSGGIELARQFDLDSIRQILNRCGQWNYWENPDNYQKAKQEKEAEAIAPILEKILAAKNQGKVHYMGKEQVDQTQRKVFNWDDIDDSNN
jgi:hypothetical protein